MVKSPPTMRETQVQSLGGEDPLEEGMANHSSIPAWRIPWTEEPGGLQSMESQRVGRDLASETTSLETHGSVRWIAGVQPQQDPGGTLRMNGVGERERRHVRPALIGPSLRGRERERDRERERESDQTGGAAGRVWQCFIFYHSFYTLS